MSLHERDIIICGGSLAGLSAAMKLKILGYNPCVFEKNCFPREKLCGEFLGPDAIQVLDSLGLLGFVSQKAYGPVQEAYFYNMKGRELRVGLNLWNKAYPYALAIPRNHLDFLLQGHAREMGVEIIEQANVSPQVRKSSQYFEFGVSKDSKEFHYRTAFTLDATGRYGGLALKQKKESKKKFEETLGLQCHVRISLPDNALRMFFFPGGYGGLQPIANDMANLCMLFSKHAYVVHLKDRFAAMLDIIGQNPSARRMLENADMAGQVHSTGGLNQRIQDTGLIQIGDARLTVEPFSGSGMAHALETGILGAEAIGFALQKKLNYREALKHYEKRYQSRYFYRLQALRCLRPLLFSTDIQHWFWPVAKAATPIIAPLIR